MRRKPKDDGELRNLIDTFLEQPETNRSIEKDEWLSRHKQLNPGTYPAEDEDRIMKPI